MKIALEAVTAKKIGGGGFQIAFNFIKKSKDYHNVEFIYFVSEDLDKAFGNLFDVERDKTYFVFPTQLQLTSYITVKKRMNYLIDTLGVSVVYSILAPSFFKFHCKNVMRCANAWNYIHSINQYAWSTQTFKQRMITKIKAVITCHYMKKTRYFVTQTETAKRSIRELTKTKEDNVKVVPNVLPAAYLEAKTEKKEHGDIFNIVYVTGPIPHKNLKIIPEVARVLKNDYNLTNFIFVVTIPFNNKSDIEQFSELVAKNGVEGNITNVGYQTQLQLIDLYSTCDIYFFPSLLETFSAALLEAMHFKMPIVATDFNFNKEVAAEAALYFSPMNAEEAAGQLARLISDRDTYERCVELGNERIKLYNNYDNYFCDTVKFLTEVANKE